MAVQDQPDISIDNNSHGALPSRITRALCAAFHQAAEENMA